MEELRDVAKKEIDQMDEIIEEVKVVDKKGNDIMELSKAYFSDSKHFFEKKDFIRAFEAVVISWTYIDSGLHLKVFKIPEKFKDHFTI